MAKISKMRDFRYWHKTVMAAQSPHVYYLGLSGKHPLGVSISQFDPKRKFCFRNIAVRAGAA
jgi:hypothetical protein